MNSMHPSGPSRARFSQPQNTGRVRYIQVVQKNHTISYDQMLQELRELQDRMQFEYDEAFRFFSGLYTTGLFPRLLPSAEISKRHIQLVKRQDAFARDARTVRRFIKLLSFCHTEQTSSGGGWHL